ncbi:YHS domain-containing (seleno)protein [Paraferrimonas sp. SM1919]|uniref:YHS domain-containing (seleno)protein n=1 Tax=Paraferrimonas sp. SM1919 TaxID=2662263 RepID=UPI0013D46D4F|nr:YHS domain-containing (seleno)protein [Paraferrimonas sp. SM1919]
MNKLFAVIMLLLIASCTSLGQYNLNTNKQDLVIEGYDVVNYFTEGSAAKGSAQFSYNYQGSVWHFKNQQHLDAFKNTPEKYIPQYGGYCAYAMSANRVVDIDPQAWSIHEDKLYLNYSKSVRWWWLKDKQDFIISADKYWQQKVTNNELPQN